MKVCRVKSCSWDGITRTNCKRINYDCICKYFSPSKGVAKRANIKIDKNTIISPSKNFLDKIS